MVDAINEGALMRSAALQNEQGTFFARRQVEPGLRAAGASDYLTKPIDVRAFLAFVDGTASPLASP